MSGLEAIASVAATTASAELVSPLDTQQTSSVSANPESSFADFISAGLTSVEGKVDHANEMVKAFTLDDTVPLHRVTMAIEEARMAVELTLQVRSRLVEGYREIMNMQL